jgi:hypothetical protein
LKLFQEWGKMGIKENNGGGEFNYDILLRTFVNVTMYPHHNNNNNNKNPKNNNKNICLFPFSEES